MKPADLIRQKGSKTLVDGAWRDVIALHVGEVPNGVAYDDAGHFRSTHELDIFVIHASAVLHGRWFATSSEWEVIDETR